MHCKHCDKPMVRKFRHRLMCGDSTSAEAVAQLMGDEEADLFLTDPPYNVDYVGKTKDALTIKNDKMSDDKFLLFLTDAFTNAFNHQQKGGGFYIFHADSYGLQFRLAMKTAGFSTRQVLQWVKNVMVMGRSDYHWQHEPCQPPGTMVRTPSGNVPIESLKDGDRVVSYDSYSGVITGMRDGREVKVGSRQYDGDLYAVGAGEKKTWATDSHQFSVKFVKKAPMWITYLMRRGDWWRVGVTRVFNSLGFGLKVRLKMEDGEDAWVLGTYNDKLDATCAEQILTVKYGIPQTHWIAQRGMVDAPIIRSDAQIKSIYAALDLSLMAQNAERLLCDYGRRRAFPFLQRETCAENCSRRITMKVAACNVIPDIMMIPVPFDKWDGRKTFEWQKIDTVTRREYSGQVYSLDVEKDEHYIADGIVTHNCLYGWKEGANHRWYSDRKQTTVLKFDRPMRSTLHPTMKPIALIEYCINNSSKKYDLVMDLFGGSGSTLIAAEKSLRRSVLMELDPKYCQVILNRFKDYSGGRKVEKIGEAATVQVLPQADGEKVPS